MIVRVREWWTGLARRERILVLAAASVVSAGLLYALAIEPAWQARKRLQAELPKLREALGEIQSLREEVKLLRSQGVGVDTVGNLRTSAEASLARSGVVATVRPANAQGQPERTVTVEAKAAPAGAWIAWVESFGRQSRTRVVRARLERASAPGTVDTEVTFEVPAR